MQTSKLTSGPAIEAHNLRKVYPNGTVGLEGLTVQIKPGEMVGVLGRSGAGKTTFFRLLNGAIRPTSGELKVLGQPLAAHVNRNQLRQLRSRVAAVSQHHNVIPSLSALQNVLIGRLGRISTWQAVTALFAVPEFERVMAAQALAMVGLPDQLYSPADHLSGGQQQRIAIARALVQKAELVLGDEPIASVDVKTAQAILELFRRMNEEAGATVLMNLHQVDFAIKYCQRLLVLSHGKLVYDGTPDNLKNFKLYAEDEAESEESETAEIDRSALDYDIQVAVSPEPR